MSCLRHVRWGKGWVSGEEKEEGRDVRDLREVEYFHYLVSLESLRVLQSLFLDISKVLVERMMNRSILRGRESQDWNLEVGERDSKDEPSSLCQ